MQQQQWLRILLITELLRPTSRWARTKQCNLQLRGIGLSASLLAQNSHRPVSLIAFEPGDSNYIITVASRFQAVPASPFLFLAAAWPVLQFPCKQFLLPKQKLPTCQLSASSPMMRSRYGEASDTAEDDSTTQQQPGAQPHQSPRVGSSPSTNGRLNKNDFRLMCANERLYEAYSELHCLAQGEWGAAGQVKQRPGAAPASSAQQPNQYKLL